MRRLSCFWIGVSWASLLGLLVGMGEASAQDLPTQLEEAVRTENWAKAITVVDLMIETQPTRRQELEAYRRQLQSIQSKQSAANEPIPTPLRPPSPPPPVDPPTTPGQATDLWAKYEQLIVGMVWGDVLDVVGNEGIDLGPSEFNLQAIEYQWEDGRGNELILYRQGDQIIGKQVRRAADPQEDAADPSPPSEATQSETEPSESEPTPE